MDDDDDDGEEDDEVDDDNEEEEQEEARHGWRRRQLSTSLCGAAGVAPDRVLAHVAARLSDDLAVAQAGLILSMHGHPAATVRQDPT